MNRLEQRRSTTELAVDWRQNAELKRMMTAGDMTTSLKELRDPDLSPLEAADALDETFVAALQAWIETVEHPDDEQLREQADLMSRVAANHGSALVHVFDKHGTQKKYVSPLQHKVNQITTTLTSAGDNMVVVQAVQQLCEAAFTAGPEIYSATLADRIDTFKKALTDNPRLRRGIATVAVLGGLSAASAVAASPAAAAIPQPSTSRFYPDGSRQPIDGSNDVVTISLDKNSKPVKVPNTIPSNDDVVTVLPTPPEKVNATPDKLPSGGDVVVVDPNLLQHPDIVKATPSPEQPVAPKPLTIPKALETPATPQPEKPNTAPAAPRTPEQAPTPSPPKTPEVTIDPARAGETHWTQVQLERIKTNLDVYLEAQKETGVPWEVMATLHARETSLALVNPSNRQGLYQLSSSPEKFNAGPVTKEEFLRQTILAANFFKGKATDNRRVGGPLDFSNPNKIKDTLYAYNGLAPAYAQQASDLGYTLSAEGSPYVMNLADDRRNSQKNPHWGQILTDGGKLGQANQVPGAWLLVDGLKKLSDVPRSPSAVPENKEVKQNPDWFFPTTSGAPITSDFGPRGNEFHTGIDFGVGEGTPLYATEDGVVSLKTFNANAPWCKAVFDSINVPFPPKDPMQKDIWLTTKINGHTYTSIYAHMSAFDVTEGQVVKRGQLIGKSGGSGCSTGPHTHFEMWDGTPNPGVKSPNALNPAVALGLKKK